jgi:hypothetical protein
MDDNIRVYPSYPVDPWFIPVLRSEARLCRLARAVGLKPSAIQGEARLRGLDWTNSNVSNPC